MSTATKTRVEAKKIERPDPLKGPCTGRFETITSEQYHKLLPWAFSKTDLDAMRLSPSNLIQKRKGPESESAALDFGIAFHARLEHWLNQDAYLKQVAVPPSADRRTTAGKAEHEKFERENKAPIVLDRKNWDLIENMALALQAHPDAKSLLDAPGLAEETFIWKDPDTGVYCKCRPDKRILTPPEGMPEGIVIDWKSAASCSRRDLQMDIGERFYDVSAAFTLDGIAAVLGHDVGPFVNVFVEKGSQFRVVLGVIDDASIAEGRRLYKEQLARIAECQRDGTWPGFVDFSLPAWRMMGVV